MKWFHAIYQDYKEGPMYCFSSHRSREAAQKKFCDLITEPTRLWFRSGKFWSVQATEKSHTARVWEFEDLNPTQITEPKTLPQILAGSSTMSP